MHPLPVWRHWDVLGGLFNVAGHLLTHRDTTKCILCPQNWLTAWMELCFFPSVAVGFGAAQHSALVLMVCWYITQGSLSSLHSNFCLTWTVLLGDKFLASRAVCISEAYELSQHFPGQFPGKKQRNRANLIIYQLTVNKHISQWANSISRPFCLFCLQIVEEREKPNGPSLCFLVWERSNLFLFDVVTTFLCRWSNICGGIFGFAENVWKLQGFVSMKNCKIFEGVSMNQRPLFLLLFTYGEQRGRMCVRAKWRAVTQHGKGNLTHVHKAKQMEMQFI